MSKTKHSKNKKTNNMQTKSPTGLLKDVTKERKTLLINIAILSVIAIIIFAFILPSMNEQPVDQNNEEINDRVIKLDLIDIIFDTERNVYNVWFDISSSLEEAEITIDSEVGFVLPYNNETKQQETTAVETLTTENIKKYSYCWVFEKTEDLEFTHMTAIIESKIQIKETGFYLQMNDNNVEILSKEEYDKRIEESK